MYKIDSQKRETIKKLVRTQLDRIKTRLDPSVGKIHFILSLMDNEKTVNVNVSFDDPTNVTVKNRETISREIREAAKKKLNIEVGVTCQVASVSGSRTNSFITDESDNTIAVWNLLERSVLSEALFILAKNIGCISRAELEGSIEEFLMNVYDKHMLSSSEQLYRFSTELFWPEHRRAMRSFPQEAGDFARKQFGIVEYCNAVVCVSTVKYKEVDQVMSRVSDELPELSSLIKKFRVFQGVLSVDHPAMKELLLLPADKESIEHIETLHRQVKKAISITNLPIEYLETVNENLFMTIQLSERMSNFCSYVIAQQKVLEFIRLFGDGWFFFNWLEQPDFFKTLCTKLHDHTLKFNTQIHLLKGLRDLYSQLDSVLTIHHGQLLNQFKAQKVERAKKTISIKPKDPSPVIEPACSLPVDSLTSLTIAPLMTHAPSQAKSESMKMAQQIEGRKREKQLAKQSRLLMRGRCFAVPEVEDAARDGSPILSFLITPAVGEDFEIDVSQRALLDHASPYYRIDQSSILLVKSSPVEHDIDANLRTLFIENDGRGFLSEFSQGKAGIKLFSQGKKEFFAVIKSREELRIVCGRKRMVLAQGESTFDIYLPLRTFQNHKDYEQFIQRADAAQYLRQEFEKKITVTEMSEAQSELKP